MSNRNISPSTDIYHFLLDAGRFCSIREIVIGTNRAITLAGRADHVSEGVVRRYLAGMGKLVNKAPGRGRTTLYRLAS